MGGMTDEDINVLAHVHVGVRFDDALYRGAGVELFCWGHGGWVGWSTEGCGRGEIGFQEMVGWRGVVGREEGSCMRLMSW